MIFGRTELIIGASKAKLCRESFGEVRFHVLLKNLVKIQKNVRLRGHELRVAFLGVET